MNPALLPLRQSITGRVALLSSQNRKKSLRWQTTKSGKIGGSYSARLTLRIRSGRRWRQKLRSRCQWNGSIVSDQGRRQLSGITISGSSLSADAPWNLYGQKPKIKTPKKKRDKENKVCQRRRHRKKNKWRRKTQQTWIVMWGENC